MDKNNLFISASGKPCIDDTDYEVVERKGIGHPDTLCDTIAEKVSQAYSQYCLDHYGIILRHMVDKIALSGGSAKVKFGGGEMQMPIRLYLNCRFTRTYQNETIPYLEIVTDVVRKHFGEVLPLLDLDKWLMIVNNTHFAPGPGVVYEADGSTLNERQFFFEVPQKEFAVFHDNSLRSNDTSTTVSYSPLSVTEKIVILAENTLNSKEFKKLYPFVGSDIKVMARRIQKKVGITACVPFIALHTPDKEFYAQKLALLEQLIKELVLNQYKNYEVSVSLNTRDNPSKSDYYLTLTGSAIESGDEGVVGRGNRYNGIIPFTRHMSIEACCGKNPVYHVGKIYTAIGSLISSEIFSLLGLETCVYLTSQMGRSISDPWSVYVDVYGGSISPTQRQFIEGIVERCLANANETTQKIVKGEINLY
ncbi:MAG: methionine adenosyltransferase [Patescibacteria group bacterium]